MPYGISPSYVVGAQQGAQRALERKRLIMSLQDEERRQRDQDSKLMEEVKRYRMEAQLLGMPKAQAEALGVEEARGFVEARRNQEKEMVRKEAEQQMARDLNAAAATSKSGAQLSPAELKFMMRQVGIMDPNEAVATWDTLGLLQRGQVLGIKSEKVRGDLGKLEDDRRQQAKDAEARRQYQAEEEQRKATLEQTKANTTATVENQRRKREEEQRLAQDLAQFGEGPYVKKVEGKLFKRNPGEEKWTPVTDMSDFAQMFGQAEDKRLSPDGTKVMMPDGAVKVKRNGNWVAEK